MKFLIDENLGKRFADLIKKAGYDTVLVKGEDDQNVLAEAENENRILITNDLDFGKLIFELRLPTHGVVLFRALTRDPKELFELLKSILDQDLKGKFIVIREDKIRIREL